MLTEPEITKIKKTLGRDPTIEEFSTFDALWSEHCSYKSSKRWFHLFYTESERVALGIGEGAGLIDVGEDLLVGLGLESHNHPSAVDPFNGASTGVGGIIRDILSQGCRPIAILDNLRFGLPFQNRQKLLLDQVILGISSYGNCVGVPNLGGDLEFDENFEENPLVNAMCVGVVDKDKIIRSVAKNSGDILVLYGGKTGLDGIGGVTFASEVFSDSNNTLEQRGSVQIGDPLTEKKLIDVTLEISEHLSALQDLGGGGLVCAAVEMAEKGGKGVHLNLNEVHTQIDDIKAWQRLISESQERMLAIINPANLKKITESLDKFEVEWSVVGEINESKLFTAEFNGENVAELPVDFVINGFPEPPRPMTEPDRPIFNSNRRSGGDDLQIALSLLQSVDLASRKEVFIQYDQHVQGNTVVSPFNGGGVLLLPNRKYLSIASGTNSFLVNQSPKLGAELASLEILHKIVSRGGTPIGLVDSLNFGNPDFPDSYWEFVEAIKGVANFSQQLKIPVVGGNVSLYNEKQTESARKKILPSPFIGIIGISDQAPTSPVLTTVNSRIFLIGSNKGQLIGSQYHKQVSTPTNMKKLEVYYEEEQKLMGFLTSFQLTAARHIGRGGLLVSLIKWLIESKVGFKANRALVNLGVEEKFGEFAPRFLIQVRPEEEVELKGKMRDLKINFVDLGRTSSEEVFIYNNNSHTLKELEEAWNKPMKEALNL